MPPRRGTWRNGQRACAPSGRRTKASSSTRGSARGSRKRKSSGKLSPRFLRFAGNPSEENSMGKIVSYKRPDGKSVNGYLAEPAAGAKAPGMVVIQEWWGLNDQ